MMMKFQVEVCWVVMRCSDVGAHPEDGSSNILRNVGIIPHQYTASEPSRPWLAKKDNST